MDRGRLVRRRGLHDRRGPHELARALCADPRLEALGLREGASPQWDAGEVNR